MGEKFDKLIGNFKVSIKGKEYPFSMTLRQRGAYNNLRMKMDQEAIITFLFNRFMDGYVQTNKMVDKTLTPEEISVYEQELTNVFLMNYEDISTKVMLALGLVTQEQLDKIEEDTKKKDFLDSFLQAKLNEKEAEEGR